MISVYPTMQIGPGFTREGKDGRGKHSFRGARASRQRSERRRGKRALKFTNMASKGSSNWRIVESHGKNQERKKKG